MKTKVITLENVKVNYYIPKKKLLRELRDGLEVIVGAGCLFVFGYVMMLLFYMFGG